MHIIYPTASTFKTIIDTLSAEMDSVSLQISAKGLSISGVDSAHVSFVSISFFPSSFSTFHLTSTIPVRVSLPLELLHKVMRSCGMTDTLSLELENEDDTRIHLTLQNEMRKHTFTLSTLDIDVDDIDIPSITYDCVWNVASPTFKRICDEIGYIDQCSVTLHHSATQISLETDCVGCTSSVTLTNQQQQKLHCEEKVEQKEPIEQKEQKEQKTQNQIEIEYENTEDCSFEVKVGMQKLQRYSGLHKLTKRVYVHAGIHYPLLLHFPIHSYNKIVGHAKCHIAPRVDE